MDLQPNQRYDEQTNVLVTDDGEHTIIEFNPNLGDEFNDSKHDENLAEVLEDSILATIASDLLKDIEEDEQSRSEWMEVRRRAIGLLGLQVVQSAGDISNGGAPLEGMSTYMDSGLLEASIRFQANARGELLPSGGPVKVENDGEPNSLNDQQADMLEKSVNNFLTVTSTEYVPDTDRLFFQVGWSGVGFKKGFHCPLRRRPVIESIDAKDLIVSNQATDIDGAPRVTHVIKMSKTTLIRMQIAGAYRDITLSEPVEDSTTVDRKISDIQGIKPVTSTSQQDLDRTIYECYADYDVPGYEHKLKGKITGLPIPYKFTIDKASRQILEIRRNWKEGDEQCTKRKTFVMYPFIPALGFYPMGLMHILGNATLALTAAFRIILDNGQFNNFPGFLYAKTGTGQDKNDFRVAPGTGVGVNVSLNGKLSDSIMPLPYKQTDPSFISFLEQIKMLVSRLGGTGEMQIGEGNQQAPVGTTIALIEQAQKIMSAVHKRLHQAQAEEFRILRELLQEDPEALWRDKPRPPFNAQVLKDALENYELTPQADPNVSSHMVRLARAEAFRNLVSQTLLQDPTLWDARGAIAYYLDQLNMPEGKRFIMPPPPPAPPMQAPDPHVIKANSALKIQAMKMMEGDKDRQLKAAELQQKSQLAAQEAASRQQEQKLDIAKEIAIHSSTLEADHQAAMLKTQQGFIPQ